MTADKAHFAVLDPLTHFNHKERDQRAIHWEDNEHLPTLKVSFKYRGPAELVFIFECDFIENKAVVASFRHQFDEETYLREMEERHEQEKEDRQRDHGALIDRQNASERDSAIKNGKRTLILVIAS